VLSFRLARREDSLSNLIIKFWRKTLPLLAVDLFFVTSGFLIATNYLHRYSLFAFNEARAMRIHSVTVSVTPIVAITINRPLG
jgi:peptidoglycan/LPS O-acetylase OafA/YrhL